MQESHSIAPAPWLLRGVPLDEEMLKEIREDASEDPEAYLLSSLVPEGGE